MRLAIISHTEHYKTPQGEIVGWGPTVTEINHLLEIFDEIYHVAMLYDTQAPKSALPYTSNKVIFIPIPVVGGKTIISKLNTVLKAPKIVNTVSKILKEVEYFQLRTPTGIGVFLIPYLTLFSKKQGWYKYAGNWIQKNPPLGYALQRFMLKQQSRKVTINGKWKHQKKHCLTFENPCLTEADRIEGKKSIEQKVLLDKVSFCFVGTLTPNKGVDKLVKAFKAVKTNKFIQLHIVGNGFLYEELYKFSKQNNLNISFYGFLPKNEVIKIYDQSHFIVLPSQSEGFPKVIGEAMNYGCVPIVSNVSCIAQYVNPNYNGFLIQNLDYNTIRHNLEESLRLSAQSYKTYNIINHDLAKKFTYTHYNAKIKTEILNAKTDI